MTEYKRLSKNTLCQRLTKIKKPLILMHKSPDADTVGTACALAHVYELMGKEAYIACHDRIPKRLEFIVSYTGAHLFEGEDISGFDIIAVDVASRNQLGSFGEKIIGKNCIMIDHHAMGEVFGDYYISSDASSAAEVLYDVISLLCRRGIIKEDKKTAYSIYAAMASDTGSFKYSCSPKTMRIAAQLIKTGIDYSDISHKLFSSKSKEIMLAEGYIASNIKEAAGGRISYAQLSCEKKNELGLLDEDLQTCIDVIRSLYGTEVALFVRETEPGMYRASMRSVGANVAKIAAEFGGGGHIRAAGCSPKADSLDEAVKMLLEKIEDELDDPQN